MHSKLPEDVTDLLTSRIDSFEKLELIVALQVSPRNTMSVEALCRELKLSKEDVRQAAVELRSASLVALTSTGEVQLLPPTDSDRAAVAELVRLYQDDRLAVVTHMGEVALGRIRNMASRFADAFVIRKKPPKDGADG